MHSGKPEDSGAYYDLSSVARWLANSCTECLTRVDDAAPPHKHCDLAPLVGRFLGRWCRVSGG